MSRSKTLPTTPAHVRKRATSKAPSRTRALATGKTLNAILCVPLAVATIALYIPVGRHAFFVFDDRDYVTGNPHIHGGLAWSTIKWAFTSTESANWHPLTWLSHALDYQLFGLNPAGHHLDSVLIHTVNAVALFLLFAWVTKRVGPSLLVAALFAFHPFNVESVAWVAERKNVLSTLFFLLAIAAYAWYAKKPDWRRYLLVAALFAAGLMAKPMVITLPFVLLLLDYWPLGRTVGSPSSVIPAPQLAISRLLLEKIPLLVLSAASACITLRVQRTGHAMRTLQQFPLAIRIENAIVAYGLYLWKMVWPARLAPLYPHSATLRVWQVTLSSLILVGVTVLVVVLRRKRYLPVGWFWFLGTLVPVIGLVQVGDAALADRYAYVPLIGIFVMIAWGLDDLAEAKKVRTFWLVIPALCALTALGFATSRQLNYWDNDYDLWSHALVVNERNPFAHDAMGSALLEPSLAAALNRWGNLDTEQKRMDEARWHFERAVELRRQLMQQNPAAYLPDMATTLSNLGSLDRLQNRMDEARQHYEEALKIYRQLAQQNPAASLPDVAAMLNNLGYLDRLQNRMDEARQHCEEALRIHRQLAQQSPDPYLPDMAMTLNNLALLERLQKRLDEASQYHEEALKIQRQLAEQNPEAYLSEVATTLNNMGNLELLQKRLEEAREHYEEALKIHRQLEQQSPNPFLPDMAGTLNNLGFLDRIQNRDEESRAHYTEAMTIYRELAHGNSGRYAHDIARVQASLEELGKKAPSQ
ncbi:MAG: tetratricopeptide repeat protein [Terriglobales bacterium]|jgi:tetratricopeptide (TPR) repeat protein